MLLHHIGKGTVGIRDGYNCHARYAVRQPKDRRGRSSHFPLIKPMKITDAESKFPTDVGNCSSGDDFIHLLPLPLNRQAGNPIVDLAQPTNLPLNYRSGMSRVRQSLRCVTSAILRLKIRRLRGISLNLNGDPQSRTVATPAWKHIKAVSRFGDAPRLTFRGISSTPVDIGSLTAAADNATTATSRRCHKLPGARLIVAARPLTD